MERYYFILFVFFIKIYPNLNVKNKNIFELLNQFQHCGTVTVEVNPGRSQYLSAAKPNGVFKDPQPRRSPA